MAKTAAPSNAAELAELVSDRDNVSKMLDDGSFTTMLTGYIDNVVKNDTDLAKQIQEQTQLALAEVVNSGKITDEVKRLSRGVGRPAAAARHNKLYNKKAIGARLDDSFDDIGDLVRSQLHFSNKMADRASLAERASKANEIINSYGSTIPADGGFLIPEALRAELLSLSLEKGVTRGLATIFPMETLTLKIPMVDETSHASSVFGGVTAYWTEEAASMTESQATFGAVKLEADKLTIYSEFPNELAMDASAFGAFLNQRLPEALAWFEDDAFINGTGVGEPLGWLNADAAVSVTKETGQAAATIVWENIVKMYSRMLPTSHGNAVWIASHDTFPELATMALSVGTGGSAIWLNNGVAGPPMTILGRPVYFTEKTSVLGTAGDINFVDLSYYVIGDRQSMQVDTSAHYKFQNDKTALRLIQRVTGRPWIQSALTPRNGSSSTLSPFVKTATRA